MNAVALFAAVAAATTAQPMTNSIGMSFVLVQPGQMQVGVFTPRCYVPGDRTLFPVQPMTAEAQWGDADSKECQRLVKRATSAGYKVKIRHGFYIGQYEVTQGQWRAVMGNNPSLFQGAKAEGDSDRRPVDSVSWAAAMSFVARLNALEHTNAYRLPTEFEWEYACRAGGSGQQSWNDIGRMAAGVNAPGQRGTGARPLVTTDLVGSKSPNAWGLYDMLGNVWEWVADGYNEKIFADRRPSFRKDGEHVLKGGGFTSDVKNTLCATHGGGPSDSWNVGFRIIKDAP